MAALRKLLPGNVYAVTIYTADEGAAVRGKLIKDLPASALDRLLVDYVAYGPFAATATKSDAGGPIGADGLAAVRKQIMLSLIAIGGIDARNVAKAVRAGADGIAVVSAIMAATDPEGASRQLRTAIDLTKAEVEKAL
jgi:thiamine-phosphate diphosphorylase